MGQHCDAGPTVIVADGARVYLGASYGNIGSGREIGQVAKDEEGVRTMWVLGENMAWLLRQLAAGVGTSSPGRTFSACGWPRRG
jgi:hypothetical protein